jgi:hypothetical protein
LRGKTPRTWAMSGVARTVNVPWTTCYACPFTPLDGECWVVESRRWQWRPDSMRAMKQQKPRRPGSGAGEVFLEIVRRSASRFLAFLAKWNWPLLSKRGAGQKSARTILQGIGVLAVDWACGSSGWTLLPGTVEQLQTDENTEECLESQVRTEATWPSISYV